MKFDTAFNSKHLCAECHIHCHIRVIRIMSFRLVDSIQIIFRVAITTGKLLLKALIIQLLQQIIQ